MLRTLLLALSVTLAACGDDLAAREPQPDSAIDASIDARTVQGPGPLPPQCFPGWHRTPTGCVRNADAGALPDAN